MSRSLFSFSRIALLQLALACPAFAALGDGLAAYYNFETNLQDQSGNGRHLTSSGTPEAAWAGGTVTRATASVARNTLLAGKAVNLVTADSDALKAPIGSGATAVAAGSYNLGGNFTISAWQYLAPLSTSTGRFFVFEGANFYDVSWGTNTVTGGNTFVPYNSQTAGTAIELTRSEWHQVVHVFETIGDSILMTAYVDGVVISQLSQSASAMDFSRLNIGSARDGQGRYWDGLLDEVTIWNRALLANDLTELRVRGLNGFGVTQDLTASNKAYLNLASAQPLVGTVNGSGLYNLNQQVSITAQPALGYKFTGWTGGFAGQPASFIYTATVSVSAIASFVKDTDDSDGDGISNYDELAIHGTNPALADTDGDGVPDGDEINFTKTDPKQSDAAMLLAAAHATFGPANTGGIALDRPTITRDAATGDRFLTLGLLGSANLVQWSPIAITAQAIAVLPSGNLQLTVPAPSISVSFYGIYGNKP